jgi:hypothetical protein
MVIASMVRNDIITRDMEYSLRAIWVCILIENEIHSCLLNHCWLGFNRLATTD